MITCFYQLATGSRPLEILNEGVIIDMGGQRNTIAADTVVLALGFKPRDGLQENLQDKVPEVYAIGDCVEPRKVINAIWEGFRMARLI